MSYRRLIFVTYWAILCLLTHLPMTASRPVSSHNSWYELLLVGVAELGRAEVFTRVDRVDKMLHIGAYAVLTALAFGAASTLDGFFRSANRRRSAALVAAIIVLLAVYGMVDEMTQPLFGRSFEWRDYFSNLVGISAAALLVVTAFRLRLLTDGSPEYATDA